MMERVGDEVARELGRFGPVSEMAPLVEAWPGMVGAGIARNAWPARISRDGTLHVHARDSVWAFELTSRAEEVRARLGKLAPPRLAFTPGPLPEHSSEPSGEGPPEPPEPSAQHVAEADSLSRVIRDDGLRKVVAKTIAASLARADNDRLFW
jgi:hypothetical protein